MVKTSNIYNVYDKMIINLPVQDLWSHTYVEVGKSSMSDYCHWSYCKLQEYHYIIKQDMFVGQLFSMIDSYTRVWKCRIYHFQNEPIHLTILGAW
jgi:hypothetical protein